MSSPAPMSATVFRRLAVIGVVVMAEPLSATLLFPFIYFMVRGSNIEDQYIGFWAGIITSAFFIPQMLTATLWGMLSDRVGRRPVMLFGLLGSAVCMLLFGLSKSLAWAIISRGFCGLFNGTHIVGAGNAAVARTAVGESAYTTNLNQGKAFSLFGLASAIGYVMGPLLGGFLSNSGPRFGFRGPIDIFVTYPFLLPCFVSGCFNIVVFGMSLFWLDETNQEPRWLLHKEIRQQDAENGHSGAPEESNPLLGTPAAPLGSTREDAKTNHSNSSIIGCLLGIVCIAFHAIIFDEIYPVFAATQDDVGLGFTSGDIAASLSLMGPVIFLAQLVLFPFLSNRFSALALWRASAVTFAVVYLIFSLLPQLEVAEQRTIEILRWIMLLGLLTVRFTANVVAYTSVAVLLNQVALPQNRGAIMRQVSSQERSVELEVSSLTFLLCYSMGQTAISLGRAAGPAVGGLIWSWSLDNGYLAPFDSHFLFFFEFFLTWAQLLTSIRITIVG